MGSLSPIKRSLLEKIGWAGIEPERLLGHGREFEELEGQGLIVFWPIGRECPRGVYGGAVAPGRWYLTTAGAEAIGLTSGPLRFS